MLTLDPHIHSIYSGDARGTPKEIIKTALKKNLNAIAISDHNTLIGSKIGQTYNNKYPITILPSIEITSQHGHILGLGVQDHIPAQQTAEETIEQIHDQDAIAILAHPYVRYRNGVLTHHTHHNLKFDAIETRNSRFIFGIANHRTKRLAQKNHYPSIGSSDAHFLEAIGSCYTQINTEADADCDTIIQAIQKGKTEALGHRTPIKCLILEVINKKIKKIY